MHALVTGGAGFIGSHLVEHLVETGWRVTILDDLSTGSLDNLDHVVAGPHRDDVEVVIGCVTDAPLVHRLAEGADVIHHLAAAVGVLTIQTQTLRSMKTNLVGTEIVLEAARRTGATVLLASTSEVYGKNTRLGLREDDDRIMGSPLLSRWSYAEAKALDETLAQQYHLHHGVATVIVRLFNTTGPRQAGRYGMVLPRFVRQALDGDPLTVYGDGEQTRCFGHVHDVVPMLALLPQIPSAIGSVFNIGNPEQVSINRLAERVIAHQGSSSGIVHVDYETAYGPGFEDMERRVPDCTRLHELTGYRPRYTLDLIVASVTRHLSADRPATRVTTPALAQSTPAAAAALGVPA